MKATAAAPKLVLLDEKDYPDELKELFAYIRELDAEGGPHWARVDRAELERFLAQLRAPTSGRRENRPQPESRSVLGAVEKQEGLIERREQGTSPAGKGGRRKYEG